MRQKGPFRRLSQVLAVVLVPAIVLTSVPVQAAPPPAAQAETEVPPETPVGTPPPPAPEVTVNRTIPQVTPVAVIPVFSDPPTDAEIFRARLFTEPFVPMGETSADENRALAKAILEYRLGTDDEDVSAFGTFLFENPRSAWRASVITNLGAHYRRTGYYTKATDSLAEAWALAKNDTTPMGRATAARALSELLDMHMQFGKVEELEALTAQVKGREMSGGIVQRLAQADRAIWVLRHAHHEAIASAAVSVDNLMGYGKKDHKQHPDVAKFHATPQGAALSDVHALTRRVGLRMQMARRDGGDFVVPSIVHLKAGHFTALVKQDGDRFLLSDPMLGGEVWMSRAALQEEASGYSLLPEGRVRRGWRSANAGEVRIIRGKCVAAMPNYGCTTSFCSRTGGPGPCPRGMATYSFHSLLVSLSVADIPVGYTPPRGPAVEFELTYNQREAYQPAIFPFSNFGPRWNFAWLAYIEDTPSNLSAPVNVHPPGGGLEVASGFSVDRYLPDFDSRAVVVRTSSSPIRYERRLPDGSMEVYSQPDSGVSPRRVFLTERRDPAGNAAQVTHDGELRIAAVTDAIGQVSTMTYGLSDPLLITKVTDPFGRSATFDYNSNGQLTRITDVIGITSEFEYGNDDFIRALTTPYGTTTFAHGLIGVGFPIVYPTLWVEAIDPLGGTERIEYDWDAPELPASDPANTVPKGFVNNVNLDLRNTYYWDKRAMALHPGDHTKARIMHWLWSPNSAMKVVDALHSEKLPLENRVWYGQMGEAVGEGSSPQGQPAKVGRVLDDGSTQIHRYEHGPRGNVLRKSDPVGRETVYEYDTNEVDLLRVEQKNGSKYDLLEARTYNSQHRPLTITDTAGQATTVTYNAQGQVATITTPPRAGITENRTTTFTYDANGYLQSVAGPALGATVNATYDGYGRVRTWTDQAGHTLIYDYDTLDRITKVTYPDGTYERIVYNRLDAQQRRDRLGRWTQTLFDALRRPVGMRDPLGRVTTQQWCTCGSLDKVIDGNNNATTWERDVQGRLTRETRADNSFTQYVYETTTSRLKQRIDRKNQTTSYSYSLDDRLQQATYTNAQNPTPTVSYTYDSVYPRVATMTDGTGTTTWTYSSITTTPTLGAGLLASVSGPVGSSTYSMSFTYDELGRATSRSIDGSTVTGSFDALGRVSSETNGLGTINHSYVGATGRLSGTSFPNGQTTSYLYFDNLGDNRLLQIKHLDPATAVLSKFDYTYDAVGTIKAWSQQAGASPAKVYTFGYDTARQLTSGVISGVTPPPVPSRFGYAYDNAGNRTAEQIDDVVTGATYNNLSQLVSTQPGGSLIFRGLVTEPATVTVGGKPAPVAADNTFEGAATVPSGTSNVVVVATDPSGNVRTNTYQFSETGTPKMLGYDLNGNLTNDGTRTYEWDAENRLIAVNQGSHRSEFTYDGRGQRIRILEKVNGTPTSDTRYVWCGIKPCQARDTSGATVTKAFYRHGIVDGTTKYFTTVDHLGSTREITNNSGAVVARYDFDSYGRMTKVGGTYDTTFGFTGHFVHLPSGLALPLHRAYAADIGRWTSEDPAGFIDGLNVYRYVRNNPVNFVDPSGQFTSAQAVCFLAWVLLGTVVVGTGGAGAAVGGFVVTAGGAAAGGAAMGGLTGILLCPPTTTYCPPQTQNPPPPPPPAPDKRKACYDRYYEETAWCGQNYTDDFLYNKCMDNAWRNLIRCLNDLPPRPMSP